MYLHPSKYWDPKRTHVVTGSYESELSISARFGYLIGNVQHIKHLTTYDIIPRMQECDGYLLLELRSIVASESTYAFVGITIHEGHAWLNDAHVSFDLRERGLCEQLIDIAGHMLGRPIHGITPASFRYL